MLWLVYENSDFLKLIRTEAENIKLVELEHRWNLLITPCDKMK